jgi:hypothetical protein
MPRFLKICLLTIPVAFLFLFLFLAVLSLIAWGLAPLGNFSSKVLLAPASSSEAVWAVALWGLAFLQVSLLLTPLPVPSAAPVKPARLGPRIIAAALLGGLPLALALLAVVDLSVFFPGTEVAPFHLVYVQGILGVWVLSWLIWTPILLHRSRREADALEHFVGRSVKGSAVGLALCLPWYYVLRRKQSCFCGLGTFWALVLGLWSLLVVGGPLLFVLARDRRLRAAVRAG